MKLRNMASAIAVMAFLTCASFAQTAAIEGTVTGLDGKPVQNAVIKLVRTDMKANYQAKTDKKGHYIHMGLPVGSIFTITVEIDSKPVDQLQNVRAGLGEPSAANFDLRKSAAANQQRQQAVNEAVKTGKISEELSRKLSSEEKAAIEKTLKEREGQIKKSKALDESYNLGMTSLETKQYDQAIPAFEKAAEIDPKQTAVWASLAEAHLGLAATKTGADYDSEIQKGIEAYNKAIELKPDDPGLHNNYGRALAAARKFPEAQAEMAKAVQLDPPGAGKYYYNLGAILTNIGQGDQAADAFKKAIDADPNYADAYYQYAVGLVGKAQVDTATGKVTPAAGTVEALQKYLQLAPQGQFAQSANEMLATLGSKLDTSYKNPNAPPPSQQKKTTTKKK